MFGKSNCVFMNVDSVTSEGDEILVSGWAVSIARDELSYEITDEKKRPVDFDIQAVKRPDVSERIFGDESHPFSGFRITFKGNAEKPYTLTVTDGESKEKNTFLAAGFSKDWQYRPKAFLREYWNKRREIVKTAIDAGFGTFRRQAKGFYRTDAYNYAVLSALQDVSEETAARQKEERFENGPKFSLIVPAYKTVPNYLREMIDSVLSGTYPDFELLIADGSAPDISVKEIVEAYAKKDSRVVLAWHGENRGISGNTNEALKRASGDWIVLMDHDDILTPDALYEFAKKIGETPEAGAVYSDEDKISRDLKKRFEPAFKPEFDPILLTENNYICHLFAVKKEIADRVGLFDPDKDGAQDQDYILRCTRHTKTAHVPKVLYHWRSHPASTAESSANKSYTSEAGARSVQAHYKETGVRADVYVSDFPGHYRTYFHAPENEPLISVIQIGKGDHASFEATKRSVLQASAYQNYEFLDGVERAKDASGAYLFFIRKGAKLEPAEDTLYLLDASGHASEEAASPKAFPYNLLGRLEDGDNAVVGAKIIDFEDRVTYGGALLNARHGVDVLYRYELRASRIDNGRLIDAHRTSAVSLDGMMVKKSAFEEAGGFDPAFTAFRTTDLCYTLLEKGYFHVYEPSVVVKLPFVNRARPAFMLSKKECRALAAKHAALLAKEDPCGNPNKIVHMDRYELKV